MFQQYSEQELGDDSIPTGKSVINKSGVKKIAYQSIKELKSFNDQETKSYF